MTECVEVYFPDMLFLTFSNQFETISHFLSPREQPHSMLLDRTDEEDGITLPSPTTRKDNLLSPSTGPVLTRGIGLHGYDGIILEVTESSQVVAITLF